ERAPVERGGLGLHLPRCTEERCERKEDRTRRPDRHRRPPSSKHPSGQHEAGPLVPVTAHCRRGHLLESEDTAVIRLITPTAATAPRATIRTPAPTPATTRTIVVPITDTRMRRGLSWDRASTATTAIAIGADASSARSRRRDKRCSRVITSCRSRGTFHRL